MNAEEIKQEVLGWIRYLPTPDFKISPGETGVVIGMTNDALRLGGTTKESNLRRQVVLAWLFRDYLGIPNVSFISTKILPPECLWALVQFCDPHKVEDKWTPKDGFNEAMVSCYYAMVQWNKGMREELGDE